MSYGQLQRERWRFLETCRELERLVLLTAHSEASDEIAFVVIRRVRSRFRAAELLDSPVAMMDAREDVAAALTVLRDGHAVGVFSIQLIERVRDSLLRSGRRDPGGDPE